MIKLADVVNFHVPAYSHMQHTGRFGYTIGVEQGYGADTVWRHYYGGAYGVASKENADRLRSEYLCCSVDDKFVT